LNLIAVSQRVDFYPERDEIRDAVDQKLIDFIVLSGGLPVPVPNTLGNSLEEWVARIKPSGIVLSGGSDIGKVEKRDITELFLLNYAKENRLPLLGLCRGMQMMTVWAGGRLRKVPGHIGGRHDIDGFIQNSVNSYHEYSIGECPQEFEILARANDDVIEAVKHKYLPWEGWMWHPERDKAFDPINIERVRSLFN